MGRNRKNGSAARFAPAIKAAVIVLMIGGSAIGYVYQKNQIGELGKQIQQREKTLAKLAAENTQREKLRLSLQAATTLDSQVKRLGLGLVQPVQTQILTIVETPAPSVPAITPEAPAEPPYATAPRNQIMRAGAGH